MPQAGGPDPGTRRSDDGDSEGDKGNDDTWSGLPCPPYNDSHHTMHP